MTKKKKENIMTCPRCGADLNGAENPARLPKTAKERIEALRLVGVDVSHLFAMQTDTKATKITSENAESILQQINNLIR